MLTKTTSRGGCRLDGTVLLGTEFASHHPVEDATVGDGLCQWLKNGETEDGTEQLGTYSSKL